jgi:hypothetical protein
MRNNYHRTGRRPVRCEMAMVGGTGRAGIEQASDDGPSALQRENSGRSNPASPSSFIQHLNLACIYRANCNISLLSSFDHPQSFSTPFLLVVHGLCSRIQICIITTNTRPPLASGSLGIVFPTSSVGSDNRLRDAAQYGEHQRLFLNEPSSLHHCK